MTILNKRYFNIFFKEAAYIFFVLAASLIPLMEFINSNYSELDNIFNSNFLFLIILYFTVVVLVFVFTKLIFKIKNNLYHISLMGISIWIFFQYNLLKETFKELFTGFYIWHFSSEIALFLVITFIIIFTLILNKNNNFRLFVLFFLIFNFVYLSIILFPKLITFKADKKIINLEQKNSVKISSETYKRPNIYFFISDSLKPLNEFEDFYKMKLENFEKLYKEYNYNYYQNTSNLRKWSDPVLTGFFFLEEDVYSDEKTKTLKPNINKLFPTILKSEFNPILIKELKKSGYQFKWVGNYSQNCSKTNYKYCLDGLKKNYIDLYTLQAFLNKSPIVQIFDNLIQLEIVNNYFDLNILHSNAILEINNFVISNKDYIKDMYPTFFFIHGMEAHAPYFVDYNCENKRFPGRYNLEGYKNSYLCEIKRISEVIKTLDKFDPDSLVIFQSDTSWIMSTKSEDKFGKRNNIFNLIKNNLICEKTLPGNLNNINTVKYLLSCLRI